MGVLSRGMWREGVCGPGRWREEREVSDTGRDSRGRRGKGCCRAGDLSPTGWGAEGAEGGLPGAGTPGFGGEEEAGASMG